MYLLSNLLFASTALAALPYKGVDWSSLLVEERAGKEYKTSAGVVQPLEEILVASGVNTVRQRIWVNPIDGVYNLDYNLELAQRAKAAGLKTYLNFHYSDSWADPGKQVTPAAWINLTQPELVQRVYDYTKEVVNAFHAADLYLDIVNPGNEITPGLLFPIGQIGNGSGAPAVSALLKAASDAIRDSDMKPTPRIMLHIDNGWDFNRQQRFYDAVLGSNGGLTPADYDVQAISYYPFYSTSATLASLSSSMARMEAKYGKEIMLVETNWPSDCPNPSSAFPADTRPFAFSVEGQTLWMQELARRVAAVPNGKATGLFYWEPAWIDNAGLGSSCWWNLLVDADGTVRSSMDVFNTF